LSLTKKDISNRVSNKIRLSKKDSLFLVGHFFSFFKENKNIKININGFGTFKMKKTPERVGRNPKTGVTHKISERKKIKFFPSEKVKKDLN
tara:strand:- start:2792 stop:3064 length:273 start_codon:yes stop_codon:yes gene_type:complete